MFGEKKNLKDTSRDSIKDTSSSVPALYQSAGLGFGSYTKTHKLITALYIVTDIMDKDEPLRNKLRTLGTEIISDTYFPSAYTCNKISEIMSFLDIASAVNIISEMNCNILRKEFLEMNQSIKESIGKVETINKQINLSEFFGEEISSSKQFSDKDKYQSIGHHSARLGVQKGSTLLKAIEKMSNRVPAPYAPMLDRNRSGFDMLKKQRREEITSLIQKNGGGATITDIKNGAYGSLSSCGEKTLQRELISMVKGGVLNKTGEKRWSKYFLVRQVS